MQKCRRLFIKKNLRKIIKDDQHPLKKGQMRLPYSWVTEVNYHLSSDEMRRRGRKKNYENSISWYVYV